MDVDPQTLEDTPAWRAGRLLTPRHKHADSGRKHNYYSESAYNVCEHTVTMLAHNLFVIRNDHHEDEQRGCDHAVDNSAPE
jgi:hypothetical protein